jgi:hypothetical protein
MFKRVLVALGMVGALAAAGCSSGGCGSCSTAPRCGSTGFGCVCLHPCESPCYCRALCRNTRKMTDFIDVYFLNYDRHDPFRCDPCAGD